MALSTSIPKVWGVLLAPVVVLAAMACQRFAQEAPASPAALASVSNRILYVGDDFGIYTIDPDGSDLRPLIQEPGLYTWPAWSPSGNRIAFSSFSPDPFGPGKALYSVTAAGSGLTLLFENAPGTGPAIGPRIPHYALWSPDGRYVAFLAMGELGLSLYLAPGSGEGEPQLITSGAPLYLAWSPDSKSLLVHRGAELLRLDIEATGRLLSLQASSSKYRAPGWSPTADAIAFLVAEGDAETLYVARFDGSRRRSLARLQGFASFLWAPQGDRLAVGQSLDSSDPLLQDIQVIDTETGEVRPLVRAPVLAFFWSPDGSKIAYVTTSGSQDALQWRVVEVRTAQDRKIADFRPSSDHLTWLTFFDQYAYSHRVWSPDSRKLVFAGVLAEEASATGKEGRASQVFVLDAEGNAPPQAIAAGLLASWSSQ